MDVAAPPPLTSSRGARRLWLYALAMVAPAVGFARRYPLAPNADGLTDIGKLAGYRVAEFVGYAGGLGLMFVLYVLALRETRRLPARTAMPAVVAGGVALALAFAAMYPVNAIDLFLYAVRSRLFTAHGADPLAAYPEDYPEDPWSRFASREWADNVSPYGPLWNLVAAPITALAGDRLLLALVGFKALAVAAILLGGWLVARTLAATRPDGAATGALFYLWNPLVLWEGVGNGHNDAVLAVPLLLALLAWARRRDRWVVPWLLVGVLLKYVTGLLVPLAALALWRRAGGWPARWRLVFGSVGIALVATVIAFFPFYAPLAVRDSLAAQGTIFLTSPAAVVVAEWRIRDPDADPDDLKRWSRIVGQALLLAGLAVLARRVWVDPARLPRSAFEALFLFLLVATWNFRGWYLIWLVAVAATLPWGWPAWRTIAWTAGALAGYGHFIWIREWWKTDFATLQTVGVLLMTGPAALLAAAEAATTWRVRPAATERPPAASDLRTAEAEIGTTPNDH